jgi:hypothetical protein
MNYEHVMRWLAAWRARTILSCILGAFGGMALSLVLLALAWAFIFMVSIHVLGGWVPYFSGWIHPLVATVAIPLLFIGNACVSQETLGKYSFTTGTATDKVVTIPGYGSNVNPLAPNSIISVVKMVGDVLFCGPRIAVWSFKQVVRFLRVLRLDVPGCAAVLTVLHETGHRMSYHDITESIEGLNPVRVFNHLHLLDGVLFLESDPPGLSLETQMREELDRRSQPANAAYRR